MRDYYTQELKERRLLLFKAEMIDRAVESVIAMFPRRLTPNVLETKRFRSTLEGAVKRGYLNLAQDATPFMKAVDFTMAVYCKLTVQTQVVKTSVDDRVFRVRIRWLHKDGGRARKAARISAWCRRTTGEPATQGRTRSVTWGGDLDVRAGAPPKLSAWSLVLPRVSERSASKGLMTVLKSEGVFGPDMCVDDVDGKATTAWKL